MFTVRAVTLYVGPPPVQLRAPPEALNVNADGGLTRLFREALLKTSEAFSVEIHVIGHPPLHCNFARCGQAAGVAHWRRDKEAEAVTAYLPGLDDQEEDMVEQALATKPYPISLHAWHTVMKAKRPIHANFLMTAASANDGLIPPVASALAFSFFSILGVVEDQKQE